MSQLLKNIYMILWTSAFAFVAAQNLMQIEMVALGEGNSKAAFTLLLFFILTIPSVFLYLRVKARFGSQSVIKWFAGFFICSCIFTIITNEEGIKSCIFSLISIIMPLFTLYTGYSHARTFGEQKWLLNMFFLLMLILVYQYANIFQYSNFFGEGHLVCSYYTLIVLPLVLLHPSKLVHYIGIMLCMICLISSVKRAGILAFSFAIFTYIIIKGHILDKAKLKNSLIMICSLVIIAGILWYIFTSVDNRIIERMMNISDDKGSGRLEVWHTTWRMYCNQPVLNQIIGNGFDMVGTHSPLSLSAHNDMLEILYDYGLIGLFVYIGGCISALRLGNNLYRNKSPYCAAFFAMLSIYFCLALVSIVVVFFWFTFITFTIGYFYGLEQNRLQSINNDQSK